MFHFEKKIKLLWDCARSLEGDSLTHKLLKSHYIDICRNIAKTTVQIPKEKFAISQMCPLCSSFWNESEFSLKLKSQQVANNSKTSKLIAMLDKSKDVSNKCNLNRKQINRAKWLKKRITNNIEINCHLCKNKSVVKLENPENRVEIVLDYQSIRTKKYNQLKCKRSELKIPHENKGVQNVNTTKKSQKLYSKTHGGFVNSQSPSEHKASKLKKMKKVSNTQKQNSVLQLAALLKNQSSSKAKNLSQKRLEALLK